MVSKKRANWAKQKASFNEEHFGRHEGAARKQWLDDAYAVESRRREASYKRKSCSSKKRYDSRLLAEAAIDSCAEHGTTGLNCYQCDFCGGWHLTSKPID